MMSDLIERLRAVSPADTWCGPTGLFTEAADEIECLRVEQAEYEEEIERLTLVAQTHIDAVVGMSERIAKLEGGVEHAIDAFRNHGLTNTAQFKKLLAIAEVDDE